MGPGQTRDGMNAGGKSEMENARNEGSGRMNRNATDPLPTISHAQGNIRPASLRPRLKATSSISATPAVTMQGSRNQTYTSVTQSKNSTATGVGRQAELDTVPMPGKNQIMPKLNITSIGNLPAAAIGRPLPGKNQPRPILDGVAASLTQLVEPEPLSTLSWSSSSSSTSTLSSSLTTSSPISTSTPISSFATLTRSQPGNGQAPISSVIVSSSQATLVASSLSTTLSSILVVTSVITAPTGQPILNATANAELRQRARLTPLARTLFIIFGALGAAALLIAFGVVVILQVKKKHAREAQERPAEPDFDYFRNDGNPSFGELNFTTDASVSNNTRNSFHDNPFLTESEKAIVTRAVTPDEERDSHSHLSISTFNDDIKAFIAKSRRLTYKISP
ncbi:hypothetical protein HBI47_060150 [Parastagonospora nodorum]|nr:hypothetical protein HBI47_060150 [Parastagonospora nodorum]